MYVKYITKVSVWLISLNNLGHLLLYVWTLPFFENFFHHKYGKCSDISCVYNNYKCQKILYACD